MATKPFTVTIKGESVTVIQNPYTGLFYAIKSDGRHTDDQSAATQILEEPARIHAGRTRQTDSRIQPDRHHDVGKRGKTSP